jgi:cytochrome c oxidase assembly protein subunit 15
MLKIFINSAIILALATIVLGAYTRLTDAGLGCPDWPGCYGSITAPKQVTEIVQAQENFPNAHIEPHKARNEMFHRYIAGILGVSIGCTFLLCYWQKRNRILGTAILFLVFAQAALGMWTVTLNLLPLVVLGHLLGGFSLLSLLVLLRLRVENALVLEVEPKLSYLIPFAWLAVIVLFAQISLGAWTSANYAALACHQLPLCEAGWQQHFSLQSALHVPLGHTTYQYGVLSYDARLSIHVMHRMGALVNFIILGSLSVIAWRYAYSQTMRRLSLGLMGLLILQCGLGLINVIAYLPLINAVAHNFVAANLLLVLVIFIEQLYQRRPIRHLIVKQPLDAISTH